MSERAMAFVEVPKGRATVSVEADGLSVVIPSRKNMFLILFMFVWLGGWLFGEVSAIRVLIEPKGHQATGFLAIWLLGWTIGGIVVATIWLWHVAGREIVTIGRGQLLYQRAIGPLKFSSAYDLHHVKDLRLTPVVSGPYRPWGLVALGGMGGPIGFDYGATTVQFGAGVDEAEAKSLIAVMQARLPLQYSLGLASSDSVRR